MSTFTKTLIASAMAVAVAGPVSAGDVPDGLSDVYKDTKAKITLKPSGCKNQNDEFNAVVGFGDIGDLDADFSFPFAGCWSMTGYSFDEVGFLAGGRIARKVDNSNSDSRGDAKDLTMSLTGESLYDGFIEEMWGYLLFAADAEKCNADTNAGVDGDDLYFTLHDYAVVKKANGKFSKNQEKLKVDIQVDSKYENDKGKLKNIKATIKAKLDAATDANIAYDCGLIVIQPI